MFTTKSFTSQRRDEEEAHDAGLAACSTADPPLTNPVADEEKVEEDDERDLRATLVLHFSM